MVVVVVFVAVAVADEDHSGHDYGHDLLHLSRLPAAGRACMRTAPGICCGPHDSHPSHGADRGTP